MITLTFQADSLQQLHVDLLWYVESLGHSTPPKPPSPLTVSVPSPLTSVSEKRKPGRPKKFVENTIDNNPVVNENTNVSLPETPPESLVAQACIPAESNIVPSPLPGSPHAEEATVPINPPSVTTFPMPTLEEVRDLLKQVAHRRGILRATDLVTKLGAENVSTVNPSRYLELRDMCLAELK